MRAPNAMTYRGAGVDYDALDSFKRQAQGVACSTATKLAGSGISELTWSRGESAYLLRLPDGSVLAHVEEGLGTKNLVADAMYAANPTGKTYYDQLAQDTVAMIVNDMITLGALPFSIAMHLAVGSSEWFDDRRRSRELIYGWHRACGLAYCAWGAGETPTLKDIVGPGTVVLSGSAIGRATQEQVIKPNRIRHGDLIVILASSGIHANGLTLARKIAETTGYDAKLDDGRTFGDALLDPTLIYVPFMRECQTAGVEIHYGINITGHGWRKLMRAKEAFAYIVEDLPTPHPVFRFMQQHGPITDEEAYSTFNMGAGFAIYIDESDAQLVVEVASACNISAMCVGHIEIADRPRVEIRPKNLVYESPSLQIR